MELLGRALLTASLVLLGASLWWVLEVFWWRPKALARRLLEQGIRGPPYKFFTGNLLEIMSMRQRKAEQGMESISHDIVDHCMPEYTCWSTKYGNRYVHWWGREPRIAITEPELVRHVFVKRPKAFGKSDVMLHQILSITGQGLVAAQGEEWNARHRVVAPAFHVEKIKEMATMMSDCATRMIESWELKMQNEGKVEVFEEFQKVATDVISHWVFGVCYYQNRRIFEIMRELPVQQRRVMFFPRFLPLPANLKIKAMEEELYSTLLALIRRRKEAFRSGRSESYGHDLLGLLLKESEGEKMSDRSIADECRTFYIAGHETTATLLSWTMMLLAVHPEWQDRARAEVLADDASDVDVLNKYKLMKMIFNESLRLYPPLVGIARECSEETQLGDLKLPKGASLWFPMAVIHRDRQLWGPNVNEFNPERFRDGISGACKHPNAFFPFSLGPRVCLGQTFALLEAKLVLACILRGFSFKLSPEYRHNPGEVVSMRPVNGVPIVFSKLEQS